ncbi:PLDc N-terminal domain-containing protein [Luethyella okanaganae]|uniref:PLDc N-terminal domain-containing protein n=1 Tax=Luethyella okanaganae TaxID=69372 RepID=A0ABW1VGH0_9MICO
MEISSIVSGLIVLVAVVAYVTLAILALTQIARADFPDASTRVLWILAVLVAPFIGSIVWFAVGRPARL